MANDNGLVCRIRYYYPAIPSVLFYISIPATIIAMVCLSLNFLQKPYHLTNNLFLSSLGRLDSLIIQLISISIAIVAPYLFIIRKKRQKDDGVSISRKRKCMYLILIALILFTFLSSSFIIEHWMKSVFIKDRPSDSPDIGLARLWLVLSPENREGTDVPSGFVMRQTLLSFITLTVILQNGVNGSRIFSRNERLIFCILVSVLFLLVASSRIFGGRHTLKAVGIGIGAGSYIFWFIYVLFKAFMTLENEYLSDILVSTLIFGIVFYLYSKDAGKWIPVIFTQLFVAGIANLLITNRIAKGNKNERDCL